MEKRELPKGTRSFERTTEDLIEGIKEAIKANPEAKTFEELADWAGKHVLLTEKKE